jgi:hypothetical protein
MPDAKRRRFFQIHLSTCIVLMFVAGGAIYLALMGNPTIWVLEGRHPPEPVVFVQEMGFPFVAYRFMDFACGADTGMATHQNMSQITRAEYCLLYDTKFDTGMCTSDERWLPSGLVLNAATSLLVLTVVTLLCEHLIRRRERQQP